MPTYTSVYPSPIDATTVKTTSNLGASYLGHFAINPAGSLIGGPANNQFYSANGASTNQKICVRLSTPSVIKMVYIENGHESGIYTNFGVKDMEVYGTNSEDAGTNTDGSNLTDLTLLGSIQVAQHVASNIADPQYFLLSNTTAYAFIVYRAVNGWGGTSIGIRRIECQTEDSTTTGVRAACEQRYDLQATVFRAVLAQPYALTARLAALLDQIYGLRMLVSFVQPYSDAAKLRATLDQRYKDAAKLRRAMDARYGDSPKYRAALDQIYNLHEGLRAALAQPYSIADSRLKAILDQLADLQDKDLLRTTIDMLYVLAAGEALVQRSEISVTCNGMEHSSMSNINIEQDDSQFHISGELQLLDEAEFLQYRKYLSVVEITVDGQLYKFMPEIPRRSRPEIAGDLFIVPLVSRTKLLDTPHSRLAAQELSGMASALVATLAAPFSVDWQLVDWFIPPGRLAVNEGDSAISPIRRIVEAVGGIIQTAPDETLICRPEYPVSVNQWDAATPDFYLTDQDNFFQIDPAPENKPGYNKVNVSDSQLSAAGLTIETTTISGFESEVRVYQVPWGASSQINLRHSGSPARVAVIAHGVQNETITEERVEIVGGSGRTSKPFYNLVAADYRETDLGAVTVAEDGTITTTTAGNSLLYLTYTTRCWLFTVYDQTAEDVQFFPEEVAA